MAVWKKLSNEELFFIMRCERFGDMIKVFHIRRQLTREQWQQDARRFYHADYDSNFISQSIFSSLNDATSYPFMTLLAIIGMLAIKFLTLSLLTAGFSALTLIVGTIFFAASYQEFRESRHQSEKFLDFATIKIQCADELIKRQKNILKGFHIDPDKQPASIDKMIQIKPFEYRNKNILQKLKPAIGTGLLTGTMLFGTYYLGATAIIAAFGAITAVSVMTGPIGLGIAAAAGILLAIYSGYRQYQSRVATERIEKQQVYAARLFSHKRDECYELRSLIDEHCHHTSTRPKSYAETETLHKKDFQPASTTQHDSLLRRGNLFRRRKSAKMSPKDLIIPSTPNNNINSMQPH